MVTAASILKLAAPAIQKAGTLVFQKLSRLQKISDALDNIEDTDLAKKVIEDFEIVKGSWKGEFTVTVDKFLRAFEATGLDATMVNSALLQSRSQSVEDTFVALFTSETGQDEQNGRSLYNQVAKSFEVSVALLTKDQVMVRVIRASHHSLLESIAKLESAIEGVHLGINKRPTDEELSEVIPRIIRSVAGDTKQIRVETSQGPKEVEIAKIYIPPRLRVRAPEDVRVIVRGAIDESITSKRKVSLAFTAVPQHDVEAEVTNISISDISCISKTVILGNPGGGKSTLLQSVCHKIASDSLKMISEGAHCSDVRVPIRIVLRDYEHARLGQPQLTILEYMVNDLLGAAYADKNVLTRTLENLLASGKAYLAFDGLDEILKTANRRQFVDIVNRFVRQYPLCQVLVTSREVGYDNAPLASGEYEELVLGDFADEDVRLYAERFVRYLGRKKVAAARDAASHFMTQTSQNASDLRRNPLMLGLMMWIFNIRDDVPSNRPEIYQECARLMFERWDGDRNIIVDLPQTFDRLQVFAYLASKIFEDEDLSTGVEAKWIEREIRLHLSEVLESLPQAQAAATALVQFIVDRSWVMSEKGEGVFAFTHQTFLEYFFAKFNDDSFDTVSEVYANLRPHILQDEWDVVSRLTLQIKTHRNRRRQDEAVEWMIADLNSDQINDVERRAVIGFSARCLEFIIGSEGKVREFVEGILSAMLTCYKSNLYDVMDIVPVIFAGAKERRTFIASAIEDWLHRTFKEEVDETRDFILAFVDGLIGRYQLLGFAQVGCASIPKEYRKRFRGRLIPYLISESSGSQKAAKVLFEWTGTLPKATLEKFGLSFIHYARPETSIAVDGFSALALAASAKFSEFFAGSSLTKEKAEVGLKLIGNYYRRNDFSGLTPFPYMENLNNPPPSVWAGLLRAMRSEVELRLGACIASFVESTNFGYRREDSRYSEEYYNELCRQSRLAANNGAHDAADIILKLSDSYKVHSSRLAEVGFD